MPIVNSQIIENSPQPGGLAWIREKHVDSAGNIYIKSYLAKLGVDTTTILGWHGSVLDATIKQQEIENYLDRIKQGLNVIGETYTETTQAERALAFLSWAKDLVADNNLDPLRYVWKVTEPFSVAQINTLLDGTIFADKADKIKLWETRIKAMDTEMAASSAAAEAV